MTHHATKNKQCFESGGFWLQFLGALTWVHADPSDIATPMQPPFFVVIIHCRAPPCFPAQFRCTMPWSYDRMVTSLCRSAKRGALIKCISIFKLGKAKWGVWQDVDDELAEKYHVTKIYHIQKRHTLFWMEGSKKKVYWWYVVRDPN